jgi:tRNA threonylcarbamoyladenosine biosynthesis protein TsaE
VTRVHAPILETRAVAWPDERSCGDFARALARRPGIDDAYIELHGPLGAGKTTFVRHLLRALGVEGHIKSPTYAVMEPYDLPGGRMAAHFDFYRFADPREWADAGLRDVFAAPGLKLAEWPERVAEALPTPDLRLLIEPQDDDGRLVQAQALTRRGVGMLG